VAFPPGHTIETTDEEIGADVVVPDGASAVVVIAGTSRTDPADRYVAYGLATAGLATVELELGGGGLDRRAIRVVDAIRWARDRFARPVGLYAAGGGVAPALIAARIDRALGAIVVRGDRADLGTIAAPVLLVGNGMTPDAIDRAARRACGFLAERLGARRACEVLWMG
jgi:hypothetical protein